LKPVKNFLNRRTSLCECHLVSHGNQFVLHLHRFHDIIHKRALNVIIELLHGHISRVDSHGLVERHGDTVRHDHFHVASHLSLSDWVRKNKLDRLFVSLLCHRNFSDLIFRIDISKHILIQSIECSLSVYSERPNSGERSRVQACRLDCELVGEVRLSLQDLSRIAP